LLKNAAIENDLAINGAAGSVELCAHDCNFSLGSLSRGLAMINKIKSVPIITLEPPTFEKARPVPRDSGRPIASAKRTVDDNARLTRMAEIAGETGEARPYRLARLAGAVSKVEIERVVHKWKIRNN